VVRRVASRRDDVGGVALEHWVTAWYSLRDDAQCVKRVQCDECVQHSVRSGDETDVWPIQRDRVEENDGCHEELWGDI